MRSRSFKLGEETVTLPRGTRVVLKTELRGEDGFLHRPSTPATVRDLFHNTYLLETASGRRLKAERDQIRMARAELLADLGTRWSRMWFHFTKSTNVRACSSSSM